MYCDGWDENDKRLTAKEAGLDCFHMKQTPNFSENSMPKLDNERGIIWSCNAGQAGTVQD